MPPYDLHFHVWKAVPYNTQSQVAVNQQLKPLYPDRWPAEVIAKMLTSETGEFHFADGCRTDPRVCRLKRDGLTALSQLPADVYTETRHGIEYRTPELRFQWVRPEHPYTRSPEFCQHRHKTPEGAYKCQRDTDKRYRRLGMQIAEARLIVIYPEGFRDWYPAEIPELAGH